MIDHPSPPSHRPYRTGSRPARGGNGCFSCPPPRSSALVLVRRLLRCAMAAVLDPRHAASPSARPPRSRSHPHFKFSPSVGHLPPGGVREVRASFDPREPVAYEAERVEFTTQRIRCVRMEASAPVPASPGGGHRRGSGTPLVACPPGSRWPHSPLVVGRVISPGSIDRGPPRLGEL